MEATATARCQDGAASPSWCVRCRSSWCSSAVTAANLTFSEIYGKNKRHHLSYDSGPSPTLICSVIHVSTYFNSRLLQDITCNYQIMTA